MIFWNFKIWRGISFFSVRQSLNPALVVQPRQKHSHWKSIPLACSHAA